MNIVDGVQGIGFYMFGAMSADEEIDNHANPESMIRGAFEFWCESEDAKALFAMMKRDFILEMEKQARAAGLEHVPTWSEWDAEPDLGIREDSDIDLSRRATRQQEQAEAALADARDKAQSALARLDASLFTNAEHQQAKDILRAMKGKP